MRLRCSLDLRDLDDRLVAPAPFDVGVVHWVARPIDELEHLPIRAVRVVRNGKALDPLRAQAVHPVPQAFGVLRMEAREGLGGQLVAAAEDHVAMQIAAVVARGRVFVCGECRELTRVVELLGGVDDVAPGRLRDGRRQISINAAIEHAGEDLWDEGGEDAKS